MKAFFNKIYNWIKNNKLLAVLIVVILYLLMPRGSLVPQLLGGTQYSKSGNIAREMMAPGMAVSDSISNNGRGGAVASDEVAPRPDVTDRKTITESSLSLHVKSVRETLDSIKKKTKDLGGYVVETDITTPEFGEDGSVVVRIPSESLDETLAYFRGLAVKVVSENISGDDITDQYIDVEERIFRLETTKAMVVKVLDKAVTVEDILQVQKQIFSLQDQIDSYKGLLLYMDGASKTTLIGIYLSTDELGLPYAPSQAWRPEVIFKQAARSLLLNLIVIGNAAIWIGVYLPLIAVLLLVFIVVKKVIFRKRPPSQ